MFFRKAQGLSLNTIIIAIVVLVVLVVVIMIFTGYFGGKFTPGVTSCQSGGGVCQPDTGALPCGLDAFGFPGRTVGGAGGCAAGEVCCVKGAVAGSGSGVFGGGSSGGAGAGGVDSGDTGAGTDTGADGGDAGDGTGDTGDAAIGLEPESDEDRAIFERFTSIGDLSKLK